MAQTDRHTDGHGDSMTNSAQWGRVGENGKTNFCQKALHTASQSKLQTVKQTYRVTQNKQPLVPLLAWFVV